MEHLEQRVLHICVRLEQRLLHICVHLFDCAPIPTITHS